MKKIISNILFAIYAVIAVFVTVCLLSYNDFKVTEFGDYSLVIIEDNELSPEYDDDIEICVIPGITAANSGAAVLGCPLNHDYCVISLSDLLTPWEIIEKRLKAAIDGDFAIAIYNPSSHKRHDYLKRACDIMLASGASPDRKCGYVENIGRNGTSCKICTLSELEKEQVNMFTTVFVGNSHSEIINGKLVTKRGYDI